MEDFFFFFFKLSNTSGFIKKNKIKEEKKSFRIAYPTFKRTILPTIVLLYNYRLYSISSIIISYISYITTI